MDLTLGPGPSWRGYRKTLRHDIEKAHGAGLRIEHDHDLRHLDKFTACYRETMLRNLASPDYFFDGAYFRRFFKLLGPQAHLAVAFSRHEFAGGVIFVECNGIIEYHFSGSSSGFLNISPAKLLLDEIRLWGQSRGCSTLHLGGGRGARPDPLFAFKAAFSPRRHAFHTWSHVIQPRLYEDLSQAHQLRVRLAGARPEDQDVPLYRAPARTATSFARSTS
jgi:lipid II:glycine glycyltransferase (peptidoglycan interpeptide bridge formation enzyme)